MSFGPCEHCISLKNSSNCSLQYARSHSHACFVGALPLSYILATPRLAINNATNASRRQDCGSCLVQSSRGESCSSIKSMSVSEANTSPQNLCIKGHPCKVYKICHLHSAPVTSRRRFKFIFVESQGDVIVLMYIFKMYQGQSPIWGDRPYLSAPPA